MVSTSAVKTKKNTMDLPHRHTIKGNFPAQETLCPPRVINVNKILALVLVGSIFVSMASYMIVILKENKIKQIHSTTHKLNFENVELQNKVDYLKSFYSIDNKVKDINFLKKPDKVLQVKSPEKPTVVNPNKKNNITSVPGF